jgi:hypothetical protein
MGLGKGQLQVETTSGKGTLTLDGDKGTIDLLTGKGKVAVSLGAIPTPPVAPASETFGGYMTINNGDGQERIRCDGDLGSVKIGGNGASGDLSLHKNTGSSAAHLNGKAGYGELLLFGLHSTIPGALPDEENTTIHLRGMDGIIRAGNTGTNGKVLVLNDKANATVTIDGKTGDITLANADCAEEFDVAEAEVIEPGAVMVFNADGRIRKSSEAYDRKVAGVISGAGNYRPGIVLDKHVSNERRMPVALLGKVYCNVDATRSPIEVGDLLTTSDTPGHAMKASDSRKAFGAVLGKALKPLASGRGLIPVLVNMQ